VLHARDTTGWHASIRIDTALEHGGVREGGVVFDRDGWPVLNELDALNDRCNHINPRHPTRQDLADLAQLGPSRFDQTPRHPPRHDPLDRLLRHQATATPQTASGLATIVTTSPADCTADADALGHLHHQLQDARTAAASAHDPGSALSKPTPWDSTRSTRAR
jgi:hypothetical protein